jgi:transcription elongation factor GreA
MGQVQYVSAEGLERLKQELRELKTVKRREAAGRIEVAKALGDLSENAEYHEAKDALALLENRIFQIEQIVKEAQVIEDQTSKKGVVHVGSTVIVEVRGQTKTFTIVGSNEADPMSGKISNESPIGSALIDAKVGEMVDVTTPAGVIEYRIIQVD